MATAHDPKSVPEALIRKIGKLPRSRLAEVEDFVDFIGQRETSNAADRNLSRAVRSMSETALAEVWSNPEDDVYNAV